MPEASSHSAPHCNAVRMEWTEQNKVLHPLQEGHSERNLQPVSASYSIILIDFIYLTVVKIKKKQITDKNTARFIHDSDKCTFTAARHKL